MKKIILLFCLFCASCTTPEKEAQKIIKDELYSTMNDFNSYEPISFSGLDSLFSTYEMDSAYIKNEKLKIKFKELSDFAEIRIKENRTDPEYMSKDGKSRIDMSIFVANIIYEKEWYKLMRDSILSNFKPKFIGFKMLHKFREKNSIGATMINERVFYFDEMIKKTIIPITIKNDTSSLTDDDIGSTIMRMKAESSYEEVRGLL